MPRWICKRVRVRDELPARAFRRMKMSDAALPARNAARRDAEAVAALVGAYQSMVLATCRRPLSAPGDVDDAVQKTFLELAKNAGPLGAGLNNTVGTFTKAETAGFAPTCRWVDRSRAWSGRNIKRPASSRSRVGRRAEAVAVVHVAEAIGDAAVSAGRKIRGRLRGVDRRGRYAAGVPRRRRGGELRPPAGRTASPLS